MAQPFTMPQFHDARIQEERVRRNLRPTMARHIASHATLYKPQQFVESAGHLATKIEYSTLEL
eukprot:3306459-Alexandrium_andersonii.AAC.1